MSYKGKVAVPFPSQVSIAVIGCTMSGKTTYVLSLLKYREAVFMGRHDKILYCYGSPQPAIDQAEKEIHGFTPHRGLPSRETVESLEPGTILVLDDLQDQIMSSADMALLYTKEMHHLGLTVISLLQSMFFNAKQSRVIALNTQIMIVFKNRRDMTQLVSLGRQMYPRRPYRIQEAMDDITKDNPRACLILDSTCEAREEVRVRGNILPFQTMVCYLPK